MSISRRTDPENHLWFDLPEPTRLTRSMARQIVSTIVAGDPKRADELADLLLTLERELAKITDSSIDGVIEVIDTLVEMTFQQSAPYHDYLDVYRMTVNQRCRRSPATGAAGTRLLAQDLDMHEVILMVARLGRQRWRELT
jgi:hypothetical protein